MIKTLAHGYPPESTQPAAYPMNTYMKGLDVFQKSLHPSALAKVASAS